MDRLLHSDDNTHSGSRSLFNMPKKGSREFLSKYFDDSDLCPNCGTILSDLNDIKTCMACGIVTDAITETCNHSGAIVSYKFPYNRSKHWYNWMERLKGLESAEIHQQDVDRVHKLLIKRKWKITYMNVRKCLKSLGLSKHFMNVCKYIKLITGQPAVMISPKLDDKLSDMFKAVDRSFDEYKGIESRSNITCYVYLLKYFCYCINTEESIAVLKFVDELPIGNISDMRRLYEPIFKACGFNPPPRKTKRWPAQFLGN